MEEFYRNLPLMDLTRIVLNRKQVTAAARTVFMERQCQRSHASRTLAYLAKEESVLLTFPRYPTFYVAFTCSSELPSFEEFLASDRRYEPINAACYLSTMYEVSSGEDARSLLRLQWDELEDPYLWTGEDAVKRAVWTYPSQTIGEYLGICEHLCYDDYFEVRQGPVERFQELMAR